MTRRHRVVRWAALAALALMAPSIASAQGTLSVQGLGYPPGEMSARSLGAGGAFGEMDPTSTLNPAAIASFGSPALSMEIAPEFRRVTKGDASANSSTQRFPVFVGAFPFGQHFMAGISTSTLLDRTWQTTTPQAQLIRGDTVRFNSTTTSDGSVNDLAFTGAYLVQPWLRVGVAFHTLSGRDVLTTRRSFQDTVRYGNTTEQVSSTYVGGALSAGVELVEPDLGAVALSYRQGGGFRQMVGDTVLASARVPDRFGLAVAFSGFSGTTLALRTAYDQWSALGSTDSATGPARNSWDTSFGAEFVGPQFAGIPLAFRAGTRWRDLPFPAEGHQVRELSFTGGMGVTLAGGHALLDFAGVHSARSAGIGIFESAWTLSMGITIRP